jgi:hypothetical protein
MNRKTWDPLVNTLRKLQLHEFTAAFLEALGPVNVLIAQMIYVSEPVLSLFVPPEQSQDFATTLEDPKATALLIDALRTSSPKT